MPDGTQMGKWGNRWTEQQVADHNERRKPDLLEAEAERQQRQGGDDKSERWIQAEGVRQARLVIGAHGFDQRLIIPNDPGSPYESERIRRADLGAIAGIPDVFVSIPVYRGAQRVPGLYIEVKRFGGKVRRDQSEYHAVLRKAGYDVAVVYSVENFVKTIIQYLKLEI
jgi:hypothetical protein